MKIISIGQVVNVEHATELAHQFTLELPSGQRVQVGTNADTVKQLLDAVLGSELPKPASVHKTLNELLEQDIASDEEELAEEAYAGDFFGGDDPGEFIGDRDVVMGTLSEMPVVEDVPLGGLGQPRKHKNKPPPRRRPPVDSEGFYLPPPAKTVPKDELGYPIVHPRALAPPSIPDDDGEGDGTQI